MSDQMYKIVVAGELNRGPKNGRVREPYKAEFTLPLKDGEALSQIQNKLITPYLKEKISDFISWRTCGILSQTPATGKVEKLKAKDIPQMTLEQLIQFTAENELKCDLSDMLSTEEARKKLTIYLDDQKLAAVQAKKKAAAAAKLAASGKAPAAEKPKDPEFE